MFNLIIPLLGSACPHIRFVTHEALGEETLEERFYATYSLGLFFDDVQNEWQPTDFRLVGLHRTAVYMVSHATSLFAGMTVANFATPGNILDLTDLNPASTVATFTENNAGTAGTLSLNDGSHSTSITLLGQFMAAGFSGSASSAGFSIASDGAAGSKITYALTAPHG